MFNCCFKKQNKKENFYLTKGREKIYIERNPFVENNQSSIHADNEDIVDVTGNNYSDTESLCVIL